MLSTTVHFSGTRPAGVFSIRRFRSATAFCGHTSPGAYWCSALTISVAPAWRTWSRVTGSSGPYQRQACRIKLLHWIRHTTAEAVGNGKIKKRVSGAHDETAARRPTYRAAHLCRPAVPGGLRDARSRAAALRRGARPADRLAARTH